MRLARLTLAALAGLAGGGCVSPLSHAVEESRLVESGAYVLVTDLDVPPVQGTEGCGAQALAAVLAHLDASLDARTVAGELPWHDLGATPVDLLLAARDRGFRAKVARGTWEACTEHVRRREPVLVMLDAGPEVVTLLGRLPTVRLMHWSVLSGVAADGSEVLLAARNRRHHVVPKDDFLARWGKSANCLIVVSAPAGGRDAPR